MSFLPKKKYIKENFKFSEFKQINKVSKCTYVNDNKEITIYYLCPCSTDFSPICKACAEKCHSNHKPTLTITGNYDCSCGKFNHYVTNTNFSKLKRECFYSKFFEVTPNRGFYFNDKTGEQYCSVCFDNENCLSEHLKKKLVYKNIKNENTELNCDCDSHNHDLNVISLNLELRKHLNLPLYMRNFNVNILFKIQTSKNLYVEQLINQIEIYIKGKSSSSINYDIFTGYTNNSIFQLFAFFNRYWKNKYIFLNPFLDQFTFDQLIDFMRIPSDIFINNDVTAKLYYSGKFYFAEILFNYFIKSHIAKYNNLFSLRTVLNLEIGHRLHFMKNAIHFFKYNYDEELNDKKAEEIISHIQKLGEEFLNLFYEFQIKAEKFGWEIFSEPFNSFVLIFKYFIKYNLINDYLKTRFFDLVLDTLTFYLKLKEKGGLEECSLHLLKSILYTALYKNDDIIMNKMNGKKANGKFFFRKSEDNIKLIKILLIVFHHFNREAFYSKTMTYDFCMKKIFELLLVDKDTYAYTLEKNSNSDKEFLDLYKKYPENTQINILNEQLNDNIFKEYYEKITIITAELGNKNRLYFDYVISFRIYCRLISDIFLDFREFYYAQKEKEKNEIYALQSNFIKENDNYINLDEQEKLHEEISFKYKNNLKKVIKFTDFLENVEEFIHIYSKGMEYNETDYDIESFYLDMNPILNFILDLLIDVLENDQSILAIITNTKPDIFISCFIRKNPLEIAQIDKENVKYKEKIINFLEKVQLMVSANYGVAFDSFNFYYGCIRQLIYLKGNDKNLTYISSSLNLIGKVLKRAIKKDLSVLSVIDLLNSVFENIKTEERYSDVINFFDNEKSIKGIKDIEFFYQSYFYFMSELIINDVSLFDVITNEIVSMEKLESFIIKILNKEDFYKNYLLNYHAIHYYILKKLTFNIKQSNIDDLLGNLINKKYNPNYEISIIQLTTEKKEFDLDSDQTEKRYIELVNTLKIIRTIMREYYHEEHICGFNLDFYENILLRPLYKILNLIILYNKCNDHETLLIFEECLKSLYKISLNFFYLNENQMKDKFREHKAIGEITIKTTLYNEETVDKMNKFIEDNSYHSDFKKLYDSFILDFLPSITLPMEKERNAYQNEDSIPIFKKYTSKKKKIKDNDLSLIEGFKVILRETGIDFRLHVVKYFIEKVFDPINDNYIKPSYILVLNPDNENDLKKSTIFNFPVAEYKKKKSFEELEPLYENSYCLLILNKLFFRDSTNFQLALDKYFGEDENINLDIKKEEIKTKKIKQREKSHFMSYVIKNLVFSSVLIEIENFYSIDKLDSHGVRASYEDPIFCVGRYSLKFLQNLCEGHNNKEQDYLFNSYFIDKKAPLHSDIFERVHEEDVNINKGGTLNRFSPSQGLYNNFHKRSKSKFNKKIEYVLDNNLFRPVSSFIENRKTNVDERLSKERAEKREILRFEKILETSFFNFLFCNLRIIMNSISPLDDNIRMYFTLSKYKSRSNLNKLYSCFMDLIIEMLQGCEKENLKFFYQNFSSYHLHEVFYSIISEIKVGNSKKKKLDSRQLYQSMVNAYEVSQLFFKGAPLLNNLYKDPMLINFELEDDIDYIFSECSYEMKINEFKLLNNLIKQGGISDNQVSLISLIFNYEKLTELITQYTCALYIKHIKGIEIDSNNVEFMAEYKSIRLDENSVDELMEIFKYGDFSEDDYFKLISEMYLFMFIMGEAYKVKDAKNMIKKGNKKLLNFLPLSRSESRITGSQAKNLDLLRKTNNIIMTCKFFNGIMKKVEFKIRNKVKTLFFVIDPAYYKISNNSLFQFYNNVDRTSSSTKLSALIESLKIFMYEVDYGENTKQIDFQKAIYYNFFVSLAINILLLLFLIGQGTMGLFLKLIIYTLSIGQIIVNSCLIFLFFKNKYGFYVKVAQDNYSLKGVEKIEKMVNMIHIYILDSFLLNDEVYLLNFMVLMSILGLISHYNLFYFVLQLLIVINFIDTIKEIVIAFQIRFSQLICMIGFLAILIFFFSNIGFFFYIDEFDAQINGKTENYCQTLLECAITYFNHGVRAGGGIGDILPEKDFADMNSYSIRWTTDLIFYITIILLLLNMINGVIVSTFSQIRETSSQKEEDIEERCFICNKEKKDFEKKKIDFNDHCESEHNLYNYIMFFVMLKRIEEKDLDSYQSYINEKLDEKDIVFFPVGYARGFEDEEEEKINNEDNEEDNEEE